MRPHIVETNGLTKRYGATTALDRFYLQVEQGEVFGLLGPNGAGKTTLIRLLLGYLHPTAGSAAVAGFDCARNSVDVRRMVAYLPAEAALYSHLTGRGVLKFFAELRPGGNYGRALALAERLELDLNRRIGYMSTGMRQKVALAATMSAEAPVYILDEPTANLDPTVRSTVLALVSEAKASGHTVIFSSHVLSEVEEICDRVAILRGGKLVHQQALADLRTHHRIFAQLTGPFSPPPPELSEELSIVQGPNGAVTLETGAALSPLLGWLATLPLADMRIEPLGLRSVYDRFHSGAAA